MCVCVRVCVCTCVYVHTHTHTCTSICTYIHLYVWMNVFLCYMYMFICMHTLCLYACTHIHICVCVHVHVYVGLLYACIKVSRSIVLTQINKKNWQTYICGFYKSWKNSMSFRWHWVVNTCLLTFDDCESSSSKGCLLFCLTCKILFKFSLLRHKTVVTCLSFWVHSNIALFQRVGPSPATPYFPCGIDPAFTSGIPITWIRCRGTCTACFSTC